MPSNSRFGKLLFSVLFIFLFSCIGETSKPVSTGNSSSSSSGQPGQSKIIFNEPTCNASIEKSSGIRRLNRTEIINAINDVFGSGGEAMAILPFENPGSKGYYTNSKHLTTTFDWVQEYIYSSYELASQFVAEGKFAKSCGTDIYDLERCLEKQPASQCPPVTNELNGKCVGDEIKDLAKKLFRRPIDGNEVLRYTYSIPRQLADRGASFHTIKSTILSALLVSPNFLFTLIDDDRSQLQIIEGKELAERLSLGLWASLPDDTLLKLSEEGRLHSHDEELEKQINRMINDKKFERFYNTFFSVWLELNHDFLVPRENLLNQYDTQLLEQDLRQESLSFLRHAIENNLSLRDIFTADYSFLNDRLRQFYKLPENSSGDKFVKTQLGPNNPRRGLLMQAANLMVSSMRHYHIISDRGRFFTERMLCKDLIRAKVFEEPISSLREENRKIPKVKDRIAQRQNDSQCAECHNLIDPFGSAFGQFNELGKVTNIDVDGDPLYISGSYLGNQFDKPVDVINIALNQGDVQRCFASHLLSYMTGREVDFNKSNEDACHIENALWQSQVDGKIGIQSLIKELLLSPAFTQRGPANNGGAQQ